ncbi:hypothetical protein DCS32_03380 [Dokdonia sp. Dokd-P16]|nr:hypothetical protein DCS32_03380 [Dokdonia sp. Dokd-P16]
MPSLFLHLLKVHANVHDSTMKLNYSEPKFYTGGVDIFNWSKLSKGIKTNCCVYANIVVNL